MARRRVTRKLRRAPRRNVPAYRDYAAHLRNLVRGLGAQFLEAVHGEWTKWETDAIPLTHHDRADISLPREIRLVVEGVRAEFRVQDKAKRASQTQGEKVNAKNADASNAQTKPLIGVEPFTPDDQAAQDLVALFVEGNTGLIDSITQVQAEQIGQIVQDNLISGASLANTAQQIAERTGVAESRAIFLARDQTSKLNAQMSAMRMGRAGISKYEWSTSRDERVRATHAAHEGEIFRFDEPPADTGNPGEDFNCRCVAIPVIEDDPSDET